MESKSRYLTLLGAYLTLGIVFFIDLFIPLGYALWMFYFIPIVFSSINGKRKDVFLIAIISSVMIWGGFFLASGGIDMIVVVFNRIIGLLVLWVITILVSQRKSIKEAYQINEYQFRTVFEQSPIGKEIIDPDGNIVRINKAFMNMFGIEEQDEVYKLSLFGNPNISSEVLEKIRHGISINYEEVQFNFDELKKNKLLKTHRNGIAYLHEVITPLFDSNKKITGYLLQVQDITSKKKVEMNLKKAISDLETSNKELERFAYVASHDLQEPLRMIGSYTQLLAKRYRGKLDNDADDFINFAVEGANRMRQLINDLLTYSRITSRINPYILVNCNDLMVNVVANLSAQIKASNAVITYNQLPVIFADETQIMQLFQNLISNAIKFRGEYQPEICISCSSNDIEWIFSVKDNGMGIESIYHDRIFVIFQRLNNRENYPGTGIGLAICKKIVERHGGRIWVESNLNEGAIFYFTISKIRE